MEQAPVLVSLVLLCLEKDALLCVKGEEEDIFLTVQDQLPVPGSSQKATRDATASATTGKQV